MDREPPHNDDAESAIIGACMIGQRAIEDAMTVLSIDDSIGQEFYVAKNRTLWLTLVKLHQAGVAADMITLSERLKATGDLNHVGGLSYLSELSSNVATMANVVYHAKIVKDCWTRRKMIESAYALLGKAYDGSTDSGTILESTEQSLAELAGITKDEIYDYSQVVSESLDELQKLCATKGGMPGIRTGFSDWDDMSGGLRPGRSTIIAARPGDGKSALALKIADSGCMQGKYVGFFLLEMNRKEMWERHVSMRSKIPLLDISNGRLTDSDWPIITSAAQEMAKCPLLIDDRPGLSMTEIRAKCKRWKRERGLDLVIIDYIQLIAATRADTREQEVAQISRSVKHLAREFDIPVVALAQLSRKAETRANKEPELSDLRESGSLEQDQDSVLFIHRPESYGQSEFTYWQGGKEYTLPSDGLAKFIIRKQRNGPTGEFLARWDKTLTLFSPYKLDTQHEYHLSTTNGDVYDYDLEQR